MVGDREAEVCAYYVCIQCVGAGLVGGYVRPWVRSAPSPGGVSVRYGSSPIARPDTVSPLLDTIRWREATPHLAALSNPPGSAQLILFLAPNTSKIDSRP